MYGSVSGPWSFGASLERLLDERHFTAERPAQRAGADTDEVRAVLAGHPGTDSTLAG